MNSLKPSHLFVALIIGIVGGIAFAFGSRVEGLAVSRLKIGDNSTDLGVST